MGANGIDQFILTYFVVMVTQQCADLVEFSLDNHQIIALMSQITAPHASEPPLPPLVPSPYIANYIEQRKALILTKLARPHPQPHTGINQVFESAVIAQINKTENTNKGAIARPQHKRKPSQPVPTETSNKINKKDNIGSSSQTDKFLARSNLYEKQKELKLQFQKRKHLYNSVSEHRFEHLPVKREEQAHQKSIEKPNKPEETYWQKHERRGSKTIADQRRNYKDLMKQSMIKYAHQQAKTHPASHSKLRWKEIEEIFQKIRAFHPHLHHQPSKNIDNHNIKNNEQNISGDKQHEAVHEVKLMLKKIESEEQKVNQVIESLQLQHFQEDLSGILMNDDPKEEIDSSRVIQQVVDQMALPSHRTTTQYVPPNMSQIARSVSILLDSCASQECEDFMDEESEEEANKSEQEQQQSHCDKIEVKEDEWIKKEPNHDYSEHSINIKKVESQLIDSHQSMPKEQPSPIALKDKQNEHQQKVLFKEFQAEESLIDILSEEVQQESKKEEAEPKVSKISLEKLANQFIQQSPSPASEDDNDIMIPQEESLPHHLENFDFATVTHQIIGTLAPMPALHSHQQPEIMPNGSALECQDTTGESEEVDLYQEQPRVTAASRTLKSFGDFLVIPEESQEESRQSVG